MTLRPFFLQMFHIILKKLNIIVQVQIYHMCILDVWRKLIWWNHKKKSTNLVEVCKTWVLYRATIAIYYVTAMWKFPTSRK